MTVLSRLWGENTGLENDSNVLLLMVQPEHGRQVKDAMKWESVPRAAKLKMDSSGKHVPVTVIRGTPDSNNCPIEHELVAFHRQLVSTGNEVYRIIVGEGFGDVSAEQISCTSR